MTFLQKLQDAKELIRDSIEKYPNIILGSSFGKDSMVTLHLTLSVKPTIPVFSIMADTEFIETYNFADKIVQEYSLNYTPYVFSQIEGEKCCGKPKVEKTKEALKDVDAWISGV